MVPAAVDEAAVKAALLAEAAPPRDVADALAELKAQRVAARRPDRLVLGADQVLVCDGRIFDKPRDLAEARAQLLALRGRSHELLSAAVVYEAGRAGLAPRRPRPAGHARRSATPSSTATSRPKASGSSRPSAATASRTAARSSSPGSRATSSP